MDRDTLVGEILDLATACQTGGATDDERARLERLLEDNEEARTVYLRVADDTVTLNDVRQTTSPRPALWRSVGGKLGSSWVSPNRARRPWILGVVLAVSLATAAACAWFFRPTAGASHSLVESGGGFARIVSLSDVQWSDPAQAHREWQRINQGQSLEIDAGSVEVLYNNGVQFVMQGPAHCTFLSEKQVLAESGKLVARVGPEATGFEIVSPHAKVIDRGTSFGMTIDPDHQTDIVVYEGIVDFSLPAAATNTHRRLGAGEAIRVGRDGRVGRIASVAGDAFLPPPRLSDVCSDDGRVIVGVTDNLKSSQTAKYYRVVAHGFREDCQAYVDRQHQWNGLDDRGIPPFLNRGDYVMTFNDDKIQHNLRIAVELAQPARLYLLVDDRATQPPPKWLTDSFIDTGWDIGIDEGFDDVVDVKTAVGPGKSIEWTFSVWMQEVATPSTVLLGSLQQSQTKAAPRDVLRAMYGIVAAPLAGDAPIAR